MSKAKSQMGSQEQFKGKLYLLSNHRWKIFSNQLYRNVMFIFRIWQLVILCITIGQSTSIEILSTQEVFRDWKIRKCCSRSSHKEIELHKTSETFHVLYISMNARRRKEPILFCSNFQCGSLNKIPSAYMYDSIWTHNTINAQNGSTMLVQLFEYLIAQICSLFVTYAVRRWHNLIASVRVLGRTFVGRSDWCLCNLNPLHSSISIHILHTVLYTFPKVLTRRICLTIKSCLDVWFSADIEGRH